MDYTIIRVTEEPFLTDAGKPDAHVRVEFKVGDDGPFFERFPKADFNQIAADARLSAFARDIKALRR